MKKNYNLKNLHIYRKLAALFKYVAKIGLKVHQMTLKLKAAKMLKSAGFCMIFLKGFDTHAPNFASSFRAPVAGTCTSR